MNNILVVCAGNICRSPMAEVLLRQAMPNKHIDSAGIVGLVGYPADPMAKECIAELGLSLEDHVAKFLDQFLLRKADVILAMDKEQVSIIERKWPFTRGKVFRLGHWIDVEIADPYKKPREAFIEARGLIEKCVTSWAEHL